MKRRSVPAVLLAVCSPVGFWALAVLLVAVYGALHAAGFRRYTAILSGTYPASDTEIVLGLSYIVAYFACVLLAPILALAGGVLLVLDRWLVRRARPPAHRMSPS